MFVYKNIYLYARRYKNTCVIAVVVEEKAWEKKTKWREMPTAKCVLPQSSFLILWSHLFLSPVLIRCCSQLFPMLIRSSSFSLLGRERIRNPLSWYYYTTTATVVLWWHRNTRTVGNDDETKNVSCYTNIKFTYFSLLKKRRWLCVCSSWDEMHITTRKWQSGN